MTFFNTILLINNTVPLVKVHFYSVFILLIFVAMKKRKIFRFIRNKYFLTIVFLIVWVVFFDKNDLISQRQLTNQLKELEAEKQYYSDEIAKSKKEIQELETNEASLEKFAREKYLMKKDNEDVFVIVKQQKQ